MRNSCSIQILPSNQRRTSFRIVTRWYWPAAASVLFLMATVIGASHFSEARPKEKELRVQVPQPEGLTYVVGNQAAISPDGRWLAFPSNGLGVSRYLRALDSLETKPIPGSEGIIGNAPPPALLFHQKLKPWWFGWRARILAGAMIA